MVLSCRKHNMWLVLMLEPTKHQGHTSAFRQCFFVRHRSFEAQSFHFIVSVSFRDVAMDLNWVTIHRIPRVKASCVISSPSIKQTSVPLSPADFKAPKDAGEDFSFRLQAIYGKHLACIQKMPSYQGVNVVCGFRMDSGKYLRGQSIRSLFFVKRNL